MKEGLLELRAAVATAAAPAITKMSVAAVRRVVGMMVVGRRCEVDALWCAKIESSVGLIQSTIEN